MAKISCFIITINDEISISTTINSIKRIADEIIVIDSGSTDNTVKISENLGAKVIYNKWQGHSTQKAFGESICKNDWILNIAPDEEFTQELQDEIEFIFSKNYQDRYLAYNVNLVIMHTKDLEPRFLAPANKFIRIYNKRFCSFANTYNSPGNGCIEFNTGLDFRGKIYDLNEIAYRRLGTSIEQLGYKANFYSNEQAKDLLKQGKNISSFKMVIEMIVCFFKIFFIKRYFIFGFDGFVHSIMSVFARFISLARARKLYCSNNSSPQKEQI